MAAAVYPCRLRWDIWNPFLPFRIMELPFYHGTPTMSMWTVTLLPNGRSLNVWAFKFSLECCQFGKRDYVVVADRLEVKISANRKIVQTKEEDGYSFCAKNQHTYEFEVHACPSPTMEPDHLEISVEISFPNQSIEKEENFEYETPDQVRLSEDLGRLLTCPLYSDMRLMPWNSLSSFRVHSCIMHARWDGFFARHHRTIAGEIDIHISHDVLREILTYMYSGRFLNWRGPPDERTLTELFQVIHKYQLYHLHKVFIREDLQQKRETVENVIKKTTYFKLDGQPFSNPVHTWRVQLNAENGFVLQVQFFLSLQPPSFSYTLRSRCPDRTCARVNFEFARGRETLDVLGTVHDRDYIIDSNATVESGSCQFAGDCQELKDFMERRRLGESGTEFRHSIRCILYVSDGGQVTIVKRQENGDYSDDEERLNVLSDHMSELLRQHAEADLRVVCRAENPNNPEIHLLHKAIFATRVPEWKAVFEDIPEDDLVLFEEPREWSNFPNDMTCILSSAAFRLVIDYIYTGKVPPIPTRFLDEIERFAVLGKSTSLQRVVGLIRFKNNVDELYPSLFR
ncbi:hypothetical protein AVEN_273021-1 [Araneus ventricosus]|uniref:BTB domain-containing protein n=1 Tax=Araneus ventricosus TaxID=182803 RepID=A0A4Y2EZ70_ARAVE|nr:hypothetical protein AVEN_273021-1 [Araneus ventricosus]